MTFTPDFDAGPHARAQLGFIAVANADLTERDMFLTKPEGVGVHFTRVRMPKICTVDSLAAMEEGLDDALDTLMPAREDTDVICYNCTAGSFVIGEDTITAKMRAKRPGVQATTLLTGAVTAMKAMNAGRIALGTAYTDDINRMEAGYFETQGISCVSVEGLSLMTDAEMNRVTPESLLAFAEYVDRPDADAVFLSCGALRSIEVLDAAEQRLGKPVLASNQTSMWHCLRLAGVEDRIQGYGALLRDL
ncbi:hypothetical protein RA19_24430 [Leisingera sp. ANG-M1]|uniref:maleate cis-trans isomerase family protein n=1 Tax=Leisingera sp. ANG-M1 TaxID=1577895 RepID=UPI00057C9728|nr:hypothetical protein [Leisingera sp. ANG-M1]KIC07351.1 hypothetical protein RA19_24430 [Leisingera sp. ANG-M1]